MGPNCVGLVRPWHKMNATFLRAGTPKGRLALISPVGRARTRRFPTGPGRITSASRRWCRLGNSTNIDFGDVMQFLATDPHTDAILLYVEGVQARARVPLGDARDDPARSR